MRGNSKERRNGKRISLHPVPLEEALASALKASPPPEKKRRGEEQKERRKFEKATKTAIDIYEEALKELENH